MAMPSPQRELLDSSGYTATVYSLPGTLKVVKSFKGYYVEHHFPAEREAYERFTKAGSPSTILKYYGIDPNDAHGLILERAYRGNLYEYLYCNAEEPPSATLLNRWALQAASGLAFAHKCGVLHSDIHVINFLLTSKLDLVVADFAGASIDGGKSYSSYRRTHCSPQCNIDRKITVQSEVFALGSAFYSMVVGHDVFEHELDYEDDRKEIAARFKDGKFPDTSTLRALGSVIDKCWRLEFENMDQVVAFLQSNCAVS